MTIEVGGKTLASRTLLVKPQRKLTVYILPHSHTDIGYTEIQTRIEQKQVDNLLQGIAYARKTADYPEGARFVWNVEVLWAADLYLNRLGQAQRADFLDAVKKGQVGLNGMYLNELTGLCRPEELLRLFRYSTVLAEQTRRADRLGDDQRRAGLHLGDGHGHGPGRDQVLLDRPQLLRPDRRHPGEVGEPAVLLGLSLRQGEGAGLDPHQGLRDVAPGHELSPGWVGRLPGRAREDGLSLRHRPHPVVRAWRQRLARPGHLRVRQGSGTRSTPGRSSSSPRPATAFRAFEARYGEKLPRVSGDWTPYWEDGAGSSALETGHEPGQCRPALPGRGDLGDARSRRAIPPDAFEDAWRNVLLYSEHTWGAYCSITEPANPLTQEQWQIKQSFAAQANLRSRELLVRALANRGGRRRPGGGQPRLDVYNTSSWPRTDAGGRAAGDLRARRSRDRRPGPRGASQRLASGDLAFLVTDLPPLAGRRYTLSAGARPAPDSGRERQGARARQRPGPGQGRSSAPAG